MTLAKLAQSYWRTRPPCSPRTDIRSFDSAHARRLGVAIEPLKVIVTDVRA